MLCNTLQVDATQRMLLEELPPVLVLHLKWFTYDKNGGLQKCIKQVDFDIDLEIGKGTLLFALSVPHVLQLVADAVICCEQHCST